jgi:hypothetical protein
MARLESQQQHSRGENLCLLTERDFRPKTRAPSPVYYPKVIFLLSLLAPSPIFRFSFSPPAVTDANMHVLLLPSVWHINALISKQRERSDDEERLQVHDHDVLGDGNPEEPQRRLPRRGRNQKASLHRPRAHSVAEELPPPAADPTAREEAW